MDRGFLDGFSIWVQFVLQLCFIHRDILDRLIWQNKKNVFSMVFISCRPFASTIFKNNSDHPIHIPSLNNIHPQITSRSHNSKLTPPNINPTRTLCIYKRGTAGAIFIGNFSCRLCQNAMRDKWKTHIFINRVICVYMCYSLWLRGRLEFAYPFWHPWVDSADTPTRVVRIISRSAPGISLYLRLAPRLYIYFCHPSYLSDTAAQRVFDLRPPINNARIIYSV